MGYGTFQLEETGTNPGGSINLMVTVPTPPPGSYGVIFRVTASQKTVSMKCGPITVQRRPPKR